MVVYTFIYNISFILPEALITFAVLYWLFPRLEEALPANKVTR